MNCELYFVNKLCNSNSTHIIRDHRDFHLYFLFKNIESIFLFRYTIPATRKATPKVCTGGTNVTTPISMDFLTWWPEYRFSGHTEIEFRIIPSEIPHWIMLLPVIHWILWINYAPLLMCINILCTFLVTKNIYTHM